MQLSSPVALGKLLCGRSAEQRHALKPTSAMGPAEQLGVQLLMPRMSSSSAIVSFVGV
jgi:hypothetical protein